jgi:hypothetical protein
VPAGITVRKYGFRVVSASSVVFGFLTLVRRPASRPPARAGPLLLTHTLLAPGFCSLHDGKNFLVMCFILGAAEAAVLLSKSAMLARYCKRKEITTRTGRPGPQPLSRATRASPEPVLIALPTCSASSHTH